MAGEEAAEPSPISKESAKIIIPTEEEEKLDRKQTFLMILGYTSLVFAGLSLFFPIWIDVTPSPDNFISFWRVTASGNPIFHWELLYYWRYYREYILLSIVCLICLISIIATLAKCAWKLITDDWKKPSPIISYFWIGVLLIPLIFIESFLMPELQISGYPGYFTVLYGPSWGLSFGWYALLLAGILAIIHGKLTEMIKKSEEEKKEEFLT